MLLYYPVFLLPLDKSIREWQADIGNMYNFQVVMWSDFSIPQFSIFLG